MIDFGDAAQRLQKGEVGLVPSDTIYGLSCRALDKHAVERVYELKGREYKKPMIVLLAHVEQAAELGIRPEVLVPAAKYWPAPLTIVEPADKAPEYLHRGTKTLALRIPDNEELRALIYKVGPIVSTSANPEGELPAKNVEEAREYFGDKLDFYIDFRELVGQPSTVAKINNGKLEILRPGAFTLNT